MTETGEKEIDTDIEEKYDKDSVYFHWRYHRESWWGYGISTSEIPPIKIRCDQGNGKYFCGEDATILASFGDPSVVVRVTWLKEIHIEDHTVTTEINTTLQKYTGSTRSIDVENPKLIIKNCDESDIMTYFLAVSCKHGLCIYSNKIDLKVFKGRPEVTIDLVPLALENECVEFKAKIRGFPKCHLTWMKDNQPVYTTDPKYRGSINDEKSPVLCIKNVKVEDSGVYKIIVRNEYGETEQSENLEVIGESQLIFISGPVVVSPSETITFHAYMPGEISNAVWCKIKDKSTEELEVDDKKYCLCQMKDKIRFEITLAEKEDSAAYQLHWKTKKSNKIYVHVDDSGKFSTSKQGNCLRLFELQSVSADAMRVVFNKLAQTLEEKIKIFCAVTSNSNRKSELLSRLKKKIIDQSKDVDISLMYTVIKVMKKKKNEKPENGWGNLPKENHIETLDDIERIHCYRNLIAHSDASGMDTNTFNLSSLDLFRAIGRLSNYDPKLSTKLIKASCDIMNRVSTKGKDLQELIEKVKILHKETELDQTPMNKDLSSSPMSSSREDMDEGPGPRTSFSTTNKDPPSPPSFPQDDARDDGPMNRASPSSSNKDISNQSSSVNENMDDEPRPRASPSSSNKDFPSPPSSPQGDARDDGPMHRASPSSSNKDPPSPPSSPQDDARDDGPMHRASPSSSNKDLFSSPSLFLQEDRDEAPRHRTLPSMTNQDLFSSPSLFLHEDRDEAPRHRTSPSMTNQEIYVRAQRTEGPMTYADRKFSDNSESENHYRSQRSERPMRYSNRRLSNNTDSESLYYTRIPTRSGKIEHIRFHEVCDPEIIMDETYTTAKQTTPYGDGMFFMNRPLKLEEKIHIYGCTYSNASFRESRPTIKIGLISIDPGEIREAVQQKKYYVRGLEEIKCFSDDDQKTDFFHMYICLCPNATLSICVNGLQEHFYENQEISSFNAIWLVIEPYGIDKIKILPN